MKYYLGLLLLMLFGAVLHAQQENVWVFGNRAGIDFNNGTPVALLTEISGFGEANASVCNSRGQLLFYTQGFYAYDRTHNFMPNGRDLNPFGSVLSTSSSAQGALILPLPQDSQQYYIFSLTAGELYSNSGRLYYSIVDTRLRNGLGDVVSGQKAIFVDSVLRESMTAIPGTDCNFWLLTQARNGIVKAYNITSSTVTTKPVLSDIRIPAVTAEVNLYGWMTATSDRKKIAIHNRTADSRMVTICDFDPATGELTRPWTLETFHSDNLGGMCFSPDNTKLYVNTGEEIIQYDMSLLSPSAIIASRTIIGTTHFFSHLKLAVDGKIYFQVKVDPASDKTLGVLQRPNLSGAAVQYQANAIQLRNTTSMKAGLPNSIPALWTDTFFTRQIDTASCFASDHLLQAAHPGGTGYTWDNGLTASQRKVDRPGTYWLRYRTGICTYQIDTFIVLFPTVLPETDGTPACIGQSNGKAWILPKPGDTITYQYEWRNVNNVVLSTSDSLLQVPSGIYLLALSSGFCTTTIKIKVSLLDEKASFSNDSIACIGHALLFKNNSGLHFRDYHWSFGDQTFSEKESPIHTYTHPGSYEVVFIAKGTICTDTALHILVVDTPATSLSFQSSKKEICTGESVLLTPKSDVTTLHLDWQLGDGFYINNAANILMSHAYEHAGIMRIELKASFRACPALVYQDSLQVYPMPIVRLTTDSFICIQDSPVFLQNKADNPAGQYTYRWNTGRESPYIEITRPGRYSLSMRNAYGCVTTEEVNLKNDCFLNIPNAFTPNGDGVNDYFFPRALLGGRLSRFKMQILNRWGQVVFETTSTDGMGWDGNFNGQAQPEGVYTYLLYSENTNRQQDSYRGNVTLLR